MNLDFRAHGAVLVFALLGASCGDDGAVPQQCNGHEELCARRFDEVAYPMTHNAMANEAAGFVLSNQNVGITRQLNDGIRGLMLDTYYEEDELLLCHFSCAVGNQLLVDGLAEIKTFLDDNPSDIISIIFENYITHEQTNTAFEESGLIDYVYAHDVGQPWPTLSDLIANGTRLLAFQEKMPLDPAYPWLMNIYDHATETPFSFATPEDFNCDPNRGDPSNSLFLINHFLTGGLGGEPEFAEMVNYNPLFIDRVQQCEQERNKLPNFVAVDFYDIGDLFSVVDTLNGV